MFDEEKVVDIGSILNQYYRKHGVTSRDTVSDDGAYILVKNKNGTTKRVRVLVSSRGFGRQSIFWPGWVNLIPRMEKMLEANQARTERSFSELVAKVKEFAGPNKNKDIVVRLSIENDEDNKTCLKLIKFSFSTERWWSSYRGSKKPQPKEPSLTSSQDCVRLPSWQMPLEEITGLEKEIGQIYEYKHQLWRRNSIIRHHIEVCILAHIDPLIDYYDDGEIITFNVGSKVYSFERKNHSWEKRGHITPIQLAPFVMKDSKSSWQSEVNMFRQLLSWHEQKFVGKKKSAKKKEKKSK